MVTQAYISGLIGDGRFFPPFDRADATAQLLAHLQDNLPDWEDPPTDALLYRSLPYIAEYVQTQVELGHAQLLRGLLATAQGSDLDVIGLGPPPVLRRVGEPDDDYRLRIANAHVLVNLGSLDGVEQRAEQFNTDIVDVRAYVSPNRQDVRVFPIGASVTQIEETARTALQTYLNGRSIHIGGVATTVAEPTVKQYRIRATATFDPTLYSREAVTALMRTALNAFVAASERVGWTVYKAVLDDAAYVPELRNVTATFVRPTSGDTFAEGDDGTPVSGDLVAAGSFTAADIYTCAQDETGIQIMVNEL